jgi:hypothetical protein
VNGPVPARAWGPDACSGERNQRREIVTQTPDTIPTVPDGLREVAEEIVDEADYAYHDFRMAIRQRADAWEKQLQISHAFARAIGRWALGFTEKSTSNLLRFAHKDAVEIVKLQIEVVDNAVRLCAEESAKLGSDHDERSNAEIRAIGFRGR